MLSESALEAMRRAVYDRVNDLLLAEMNYYEGVPEGAHYRDGSRRRMAKASLLYLDAITTAVRWPRD